MSDLAQKLEQAFQKELPIHVERFNAKAAEADAAGIATFAGLDELTDTFCSSWPKTKNFLNFAIKTIGWIYPKEAAWAKATIAAIEQTVIPLVCQKKE